MSVAWTIERLVSVIHSALYQRLIRIFTWVSIDTGIGG